IMQELGRFADTDTYEGFTGKHAGEFSGTPAVEESATSSEEAFSPVAEQHQFSSFTEEVDKFTDIQEFGGFASAEEIDYVAGAVANDDSASEQTGRDSAVTSEDQLFGDSRSTDHSASSHRDDFSSISDALDRFA